MKKREFAALFLYIHSAFASFFYGKLVLKTSTTSKKHSVFAHKPTVFATRRSTYLKKDGDVFRIHIPGIARNATHDSISFESVRWPGYYLRHRIINNDYKFRIAKPLPGDTNFDRESSFLIQRHTGIEGSGMLQLYDNPKYYLCVRKYNYADSALKAMKNDRSPDFTERCSFFIQKLKPENVNAAVAKSTQDKKIRFKTRRFRTDKRRNNPADRVRKILDEYVKKIETVGNLQNASSKRKLFRKQTPLMKKGTSANQKSVYKFVPKNLASRLTTDNLSPWQSNYLQPQVSSFYSNPYGYPFGYQQTYYNNPAMGNRMLSYFPMMSRYEPTQTYIRTFFDRRNDNNRNTWNEKGRAETRSHVKHEMNTIRTRDLDGKSIKSHAQQIKAKSAQNASEERHRQQAHAPENNRGKYKGGEELLPNRKNSKLVGPEKAINLHDFTKQNHREPSLNLDGLMNKVRIPDTRSNVSRTDLDAQETSSKKNTGVISQHNSTSSKVSSYSIGPDTPISLTNFSKTMHREPSLNLDGLMSKISVPSSRSEPPLKKENFTAPLIVISNVTSPNRTNALEDSRTLIGGAGKKVEIFPEVTEFSKKKQISRASDDPLLRFVHMDSKVAEKSSAETDKSVDNERERHLLGLADTLESSAALTADHLNKDSIMKEVSALGFNGPAYNDVLGNLTSDSTDTLTEVNNENRSYTIDQRKEMVDELSNSAQSAVVNELAMKAEETPEKNAQTKSPEKLETPVNKSEVVNKLKDPENATKEIELKNKTQPSNEPPKKVQAPANDTKKNVSEEHAHKVDAIVANLTSHIANATPQNEVAQNPTVKTKQPIANHKHRKRHKKLKKIEQEEAEWSSGDSDDEYEEEMKWREKKKKAAKKKKPKHSKKPHFHHNSKQNKSFYESVDYGSGDLSDNALENIETYEDDDGSTNENWKNYDHDNEETPYENREHKLEHQHWRNEGGDEPEEAPHHTTVPNNPESDGITYNNYDKATNMNELGSFEMKGIASAMATLNTEDVNQLKTKMKSLEMIDSKNQQHVKGQDPKMEATVTGDPNSLSDEFPHSERPISVGEENSHRSIDAQEADKAAHEAIDTLKESANEPDVSSLTDVPINQDPTMQQSSLEEKNNVNEQMGPTEHSEVEDNSADNNHHFEEEGAEEKSYETKELEGSSSNYDSKNFRTEGGMFKTRDIARNTLLRVPIPISYSKLSEQDNKEGVHNTRKHEIKGVDKPLELDAGQTTHEAEVVESTTETPTKRKMAILKIKAANFSMGVIHEPTGLPISALCGANMPCDAPSPSVPKVLMPSLYPVHHDVNVIRHTHHVLTVKDEAEKEQMVSGLVDYATDKCVSIQLVNDLGRRYRLISSINSHGYTPRGKIFTLKTVFKDPSTHKFVTFHAVDDKDPSAKILLNGEAMLKKEPESCDIKAYTVYVYTGKRPLEEEVAAKKSDVLLNNEESTEEEVYRKSDIPRMEGAVHSVKHKRHHITHFYQRKGDKKDGVARPNKECTRSHGGTTNEALFCCHFPFLYQGEVHDRCFDDHTGNTQWCSLTSNYDSDQKWGICSTI